MARLLDRLNGLNDKGTAFWSVWDRLCNYIETLVPTIGNVDTDHLLGRDTAGTGAAEQIGVTGGIEFDGSGNIRTTADLRAVAALSGTGIPARTGTGTWALRSLTAPAAGFTITNPAGIAGSPTFALSNDLAGVEGLSSTGFAARTAADTWAVRSIAVPAAGITITNPAGIAGNPTLALANDLSAVEGLSGTGLAVRTATDTWTNRSIAVTAGHLSVSNGDGVAGNPTLSLPNSGVTAGTYGDSTHSLTATVDAQGRVTALSVNAISGGGGGWTTLLSAFDFASGAASTKEVDVTGYKEILITGDNLVHAASVQRCVQVSVDGGATWFTTSGDYQDIVAAGSGANNVAIFGHGTATTAARNIAIRILDNFGQNPVNIDVITRAVQQVFRGSATAINRIRLVGIVSAATVSASNFTAGTLSVRAR